MSAFDPEPTLEKKTLFCKRSTTDGQIGCLPIFGTEFRMAFRQLPSICFKLERSQIHLGLLCINIIR